MRGLYSHSREYREMFLRDHVPHISQKFEGINFGADTCRACIRTRTNTGKHSWRITYVLVSCQGVFGVERNTNKIPRKSKDPRTELLTLCLVFGALFSLPARGRVNNCTGST